ncbi:S9 family peptidase [Brachybacterium hainanense]|uniref:Prolyl oligopeptidase family serine peptidase n=1 Tax=Brachybacterium hainanense TaxID=1541174 RepID=A0ABV6RHR2_9MICO
MLPGDITHLTSFSRPTISPDGSAAVYAASRPDLRANRTVGQLWRIELRADATAAAPPRRLTRGLADAAPAFSPDGARLAFLRPDAQGRRQLQVIDARGGEPIVLTDLPLGVASFAWSPDGSRIAVLARVPERGRYGSVEGLGAAAESPRRITGPRWHANGVGYTLDRPAQVFVVRAADPQEEPLPPLAPHPTHELAPNPPIALAQLTDAAADHSALVFSADGTEVLAVRAEHAAAAGDQRREVVAITAPAAGSEAITAADLRGEEGSPARVRVVVPREAGLAVRGLASLPSGELALLASEPIDGRDDVAADQGIWLAPPDGGRAPRRLTAPESLLVGPGGSELVVLGEDLLLRTLSRGREHLTRVRPDGRTELVLGGNVVIEGADAVRVGEREIILAAAATPDSTGVLLAADAAGGPARVLVDAGEALRELAPPVLPEELEIIGRSGYPVHGWLALPPQPVDPASIPLILLIHGGPHAAYTVALFDEVQTLVEAGYAVVYGNPRGSAGYGRAHGRAVKGGFGTVDAEDVLDLLEAALARDARLDGERLGIMGGSYGGYLTAWIIGHDHRFSGAIVERGFLDPLSFQGTSDIGTSFGDQYIGTSAEDIHRQSAFAAAPAVRTPTLVIHSEQDLRCPLEQGTRYYSALQRAGVESEMLIFPGEDHELTRSGQPRHRVERFDAVLDWWKRQLG